MPPRQKSRSWSELKQAGNECFKTGQYGEATCLYSKAIQELEKSGNKNCGDLAVLYTNRAAARLKDGNCGECVNDCNMSLELSPFNIKSLLRRAAAYEAMERYRLAYVDYRTALQIECNIAAAQDGTSRMTKALTEADGPTWREKLPPIPAIPLTIRQQLSQRPANTTAEQNSQPVSKPAPSGEDRKRGRTLKEEGNALVKKGEYRKAVDKYNESLRHDPTEVTTFTNRALCFLSLKQYRDAVVDCDKALAIDSRNIKALYRRAQAHKELQDVKTSIDDLNKLLVLEPKNTAALKLLQEVQKK